MLVVLYLAVLTCAVGARILDVNDSVEINAKEYVQPIEDSSIAGTEFHGNTRHEGKIFHDNDDDKGYYKTRSNKGKKGYKNFDSFHKKDGDQWAHEKHSGQGGKNNGGDKGSYFTSSSYAYDSRDADKKAAQKQNQNQNDDTAEDDKSLRYRFDDDDHDHYDRDGDSGHYEVDGDGGSGHYEVDRDGDSGHYEDDDSGHYSEDDHGEVNDDDGAADDGSYHEGEDNGSYHEENSPPQHHVSSLGSSAFTGRRPAVYHNMDHGNYHAPQGNTEGATSYYIRHY